MCRSREGAARLGTASDLSWGAVAAQPGHSRLVPQVTRNGDDLEAATAARLQPGGARTGGSGARGRTGSRWSRGRGAEMARAAVGSGRKAAPEAWCVGISTTGTRARDRGGCVTAGSLTRGGRRSGARRQSHVRSWHTGRRQPLSRESEVCARVAELSVRSVEGPVGERPPGSQRGEERENGVGTGIAAGQGRRGQTAPFPPRGPEGAPLSPASPRGRSQSSECPPWASGLPGPTAGCLWGVAGCWKPAVP